jgi:rsbT co-antagonist protein RsbR
VSEDPKDGEAMRAELVELRARVARLTQELTESEARAASARWISSIIDRGMDMIAMSDVSGRIMFMNPEGRRMMGYGPNEDPIGMSNGDTIAERFRDLVFTVGRPTALREGSWRGEAALLRRDGTEIPVLIAMSGHFGSDGTPLCTSVIMRDITAVKRLENELRGAEERLRYLLKASPIAIYTASQEASEPRITFTFISESVTEILGFAPTDFTERSRFLEERLHPEDAPRIFAELPRVFELGKNSFEYRFLHKDGRYRWLYDQHKVVYDEAGKPLQIVGSILDITDRKEAEQTVMDLSTPLIPVSDRVLVMPLVGRVDAKRAELVLTTLLEGIGRTRAEVAILDITGVERVDEGVVRALSTVAGAVQLLGAEVVITGIRPDVAQALVRLGVDLGRIVTQGSLASGIAYALRKRR